MVEAIYHGHSFVEIVGSTQKIFIDPFIDGNTKCDLTVEDAIARQPDAIILTHGHEDHLGNTKQIAEATGAVVITTFELGVRLEQEKGIQQVSTHGIGGGADYDGYHVKFFSAWHGGGIGKKPFLISTVAAGVIVTIEGQQIYHAGDTGLFGDMRLLNDYYDISLAFLPIGDRYTMGVDDAVIATDFIRPKYAVPIHFNTWPPIKADPQEFARRVMLDNYAVPKVLNPGQAVVLSTE